MDQRRLDMAHRQHHAAARAGCWPTRSIGPARWRALATYPAALFAERDQPSRRPQLALAAVDAHARIGWQRSADPIEGGRTLAEFPSYRASFGTFGVVVPWLDGTPSGEARRDAVVVLDAIRHRVTWSAVFSIADPPCLSFDLLGPAMTAEPRPDTRGEATVVVKSNGPAGASIRVLRNGHLYREMQAAEMSVPLPADEPTIRLSRRTVAAGTTRLAGAARGHECRARAQPGDPRRRVPGTGCGYLVPVAGCHTYRRGGRRRRHPRLARRTRPTIERNADACLAETRAEATLRLADGARISQFSALVADLAPPPAGATGLELDLSASAPMRLSVQWREPRPGEGLRWRHSSYVDGTRRIVVLPVNDFRPIRPATGQVPLDRVHALLLVMDTVNARPGDSRTVTVHAARWTRGRLEWTEMEKIIVHSHFHTGHRQLGYPGKCKFVHGHTWRGTVTVSCETFPRDHLDMALDFGDLKAVMRFLDHKMLVTEQDATFLNADLFEPEGVVMLKGKGPSVENVALYVWDKVVDHIRGKFPGHGVAYTVEVLIQETENNIFVVDKVATI